MEKMKAEQIKKAIIQKTTIQRLKPIEQAEILGVKGWIFRPSSYEMEGWRELYNENDPIKRRLGPAKLIQISFCDEDGTAVFEELDLPIIAGIEDSHIYPIVRRILAINGYGTEGEKIILKNLIATLGIDGVYDSLASMGAACPKCSKGTANTSLESNTSVKDTGQ